ncbi:hypothetical protein FAM09_29600 [Niastella caeni]|uniref:Fibronectin type-III domain-containing protein n=1 Tax=Niastella caeni TaxID=2569763 RepID=A0A4S8H813_9BACT|nr:hypothetical protein [Niastella caeni]THU30757.1 hypothetical protein FAM09_29600 [Niastella caeni]
MKMKYISVLIFILPVLLQAQVTINIVQPPAGMIKKDQLWNLVLTNNTNTTFDVTVLLNLKDAVTGQSVLSAGTRAMQLTKGVKVLALQDIQPVQYNYGATAIGNFLPLGSYIACYTVNRYGHELMEAIATECVRINITPLSPPLLNMPANRSVLQTPVPQFSWIPPAPMDMFDNLSYDVSVAEVLEGQSATEAVMYNTPVYVSSNVKAPYQNYPSTYSGLHPGKTYAWQVTARNGDNYVAATETWTFTIAGDSTKTIPSSTSYIAIGKNPNEQGFHYISGNELRIKYYSFDKTHESVVRFYNADKKLIQEVKQSIIYGDNYLRFKLNHRYHNRKVYFIEITDLQKNIHTASFSIK